MKEHNSDKRKFLKTVVYVAPAILTLKAIPTFASTGSGAEEVPQPTSDRISSNFGVNRW